MRNTLLAATLVLAGLSAQLGVRTGPSVPAAGAETQVRHDGTGHPKLPQDHPLAVIWEYLEPNASKSAGDDPGQVSAHVELNLSGSKPKTFDWRLKSDSASGDAGSCDALASLPKISAEFMIATVPDPHRTHLSLVFDRYLETIISAAMDSGYGYDRYWLPWRAENEASAKDSQKSEESSPTEREKLPGMMLFRGEKQPLILFLVGDTPTSGINRNQFHNAVCFIRRLGDKSPLRILGPDFSGALDSLGKALAEEAAFHHDSTSPVIRSGATTNQAAIQDFEKKFRGYRTLLHSDQYALSRVLPEIATRRKIAILAEDATVYGAGFRRGSDKTDKSDESLLIYYPREISRLRNAYQEDAELSSRDKARATPGARQQLLLPLKGSHTERETIPQFSSQTPVTQETVLMHVSDTLKRENIELAILTGTDTLDIIFISRFLREANPDVQLALFDSDLLFVHGIDSLAFQGMYVASTYPLFSANQFWTQSGDAGQQEVRRFFTSNTSQGVYNAAIALLARPGERPKLREYSLGPDKTKENPPLWLSVIGKGGFWPVVALVDRPGEMKDPLVYGSPAGQPVRLKPEPPPRAWMAIFGINSTFLVLLLWTYAFARFPATGPSRPLLRWCSDFHPSPDGAGPAGRVFFLLLTFLFLLGAYAAFVFAPFCFVLRGGSSLWTAICIVASILMAALLFAIHDIARHLRGGWRLAIAPTLLVALAFAYYLAAYSGNRVFFHAYRAVNLGSGVAGSLPIVALLFALSWWAWIQTQRFIFAAERRQNYPALENVPDWLLEPIHSSLRRLAGTGDNAGSAIGRFAFLLTWIVSSWALRSLEPRGYDMLFSFLLALVSAAIFECAYQFFWVWSNLRRLLEALDLHPIRSTFSALPPVPSWSPMWQPSIRRRSYIIPKRSLETLEALSAASPAYYPELAGDLARTRESAGLILSRINTAQREPASEAGLASRGVDAVAAKLARRLQTTIWDGGSSDTVGKLKEITRPSDAYAALEEWKRGDLLAAEFVALRFIAAIRYVLLHLRNLLSWLSGGFILVTLALNCYPFQGGSVFRWWISGTFAILTAVVITVMVQMERDATLSRLTDTTAGKVEGSFYFRLISIGALPILTVIASHFPSVGQFLFSWLQPALASMR